MLDAWNLGNEAIEQLHRSFLNVAGVRSDDELWTKARQQFTTYEASLRSNVAQLEEEVCTLFVYFVNVVNGKITDWFFFIQIDQTIERQSRGITQSILGYSNRSVQRLESQKSRMVQRWQQKIASKCWIASDFSVVRLRNNWMSMFECIYRK